MGSTTALLKKIKEDLTIKINQIPFVIGRNKSANLVVAHVNVSRNHCTIAPEGQSWNIVDCSSSGTYVNDELIGRGKSKTLYNEDVIRLGPVESNIFWSFYITDTNSENINTESKSLNENLKIERCICKNATLAEKEKLIDTIIRDVTMKDESTTQKKETYFSNGEFLGYSKIKSSNEQRKAKESKQEKEESKDCALNLIAEEKNYVNGGVNCKKQKLTTRLLQQEEEKKILLKRIEALEKTQSIMFSNLNKNLNNCNKSDLKIINSICAEKEINLNVIDNKTNFENKCFVNVEDLSKKFEMVENASSNLESKNALLEEKMVAADFDEIKSDQTTNKMLENIADIMETEFQCTICSELFISAVTLTCSHTFCKYCITQWKKKQKTCPICRKKIVNEAQSLVIDNYIDKIVEKLDIDVKSQREKIIAERKVLVSSKKFKN